ncbi:spore germination protein [Paenibacillus sp. FSL R10-2734]|uniref:spore germination protein n=1 Tax=Paenibacillus sp. FSL R10-2734 TaxID=2954691 RepID=UPI0030D803C2
MNGLQRENHEELLIHLDQNMQAIQNRLGYSSDIVTRYIEHDQGQIAIVYLDGLTDSKTINDFILKSIMEQRGFDPHQSSMPPQSLFRMIQNYGIAIGNLQVYTHIQDVVGEILGGNTAILVNGYSQALVSSTQGGDKRAVSEPTSQATVRGPKDSFTESLVTNLTLVRRRIKSESLHFESLKLGEHTKTEIRVAYMRDIAEESMVQDIRMRLQQIELDGVLESGYLEEYLIDHPYSPFPLIYNTERPDTVAGSLLDGRVAIFVDGTPHVLIAPVSFFQFIQSAEDYYQRFYFSSILRMLRLVSFLMSFLTPALYVAAITFHHAMIPTPLIISFASQSENVPFPAIIQAFILIAALEILYEAGIRMPKVIGSAISIVGALVMGEAAVQAGFVASSMVIVISMTAITTFALPSYNLGITARLFRVVFLVLGATFGFFGVLLGLFCVVGHMSHLSSFGYPYLTSYAPNVPEDHKDAIFRAPLWKFRTRPVGLAQNRRKKS